MCAKLKCCLNYEVDDYVEAGRLMPSKEVVLQTLDSDYYLFKTDILAGLCTYSTDKNLAANLETITAQRARQIIEMNKRGEKPENLDEDGKAVEKKPIDLLADADVSRFDKTGKKKKKAQKSKPRQPKDQKQAAAPAANGNKNQQQAAKPEGSEPKRDKRPEGRTRQPGGKQPKTKPQG